MAVAERILGTIGSWRHSGAEVEADPVAAGDSKRVDVVEREVLQVSVGMLGAEKRGVPQIASDLSAPEEIRTPNLLVYPNCSATSANVR